jgi:hypothetical protein
VELKGTAIARQGLDEHMSAAKDTHAAIEELLESV